MIQSVHTEDTCYSYITYEDMPDLELDNIVIRNDAALV